MHTWHMVSRYYMSGLHVVTIHVWAFVPLWHQGLYPGIKKSVSSVCSQEVTAWHTSVSAANCQPAGPILPTGFVTGYGVMAGRLRTTHPTGLITCPTISINLDPIRIAYLASNLKQITVWSKLSPPGCRRLTLPSAMLQYKPWCHCVTNASKSVSW